MTGGGVSAYGSVYPQITQMRGSLAFSRSPVLGYAAYLELAVEVLHAAVAFDGVTGVAKKLKVADGIESPL